MYAYTQKTSFPTKYLYSDIHREYKIFPGKVLTIKFYKLSLREFNLPYSTLVLFPLSLKNKGFW